MKKVEKLKKVLFIIKNGPHLSWDLHKTGANIYSKFAVTPFCAKNYGPVGCMDICMDGWVCGKTISMVAYTNKKC